MRALFFGRGALASLLLLHVALADQVHIYTPPRTTSFSYDRLETLRSQVTSLTGRLEVLDHKNRLLEKRVERMSGDVELRLKALEDQVKKLQEAKKKAVSDQQAYHEAYDLLIKKKDAPHAQKAFRNFLATYKDSPLRSNAMYWLAETYYIQKAFDQAAQWFLKTYTLLPHGSKAPSALLRLSMTLKALKKTKAACATLHKLITTFPHQKALRARARRKQRSYHCS